MAVGDPGQRVAQIGFGVQAVELCGLDDGVDRGCAVTAGVGPGEEKILPGYA
jgi:hypothetical protein